VPKVITLVVPGWFAAILAILVFAPAAAMLAGAVYGIHFVWLKIVRPFRWMRKNMHLL
jgi:hypothetical protein